jgi:hypothetical protein
MDPGHTKAISAGAGAGADADHRAPYVYSIINVNLIFIAFLTQ